MSMIEANMDGNIEIDIIIIIYKRYGSIYFSFFIINSKKNYYLFYKR